MFDDFVVTAHKEDDSSKTSEADSVDENVADIVPEQTDVSEQNMPNTDDNIYSEEMTTTPEEKPEIIEPTYSKEDIENAVKEAAEEAYQQGVAEAKESETAKQNVLLEEIKNQLVQIFTALGEEETTRENNVLQVAVAAVRKIFPTLEHDRAEAEIKNFLSENFANFAKQDMLSFAFNPESVALVADSLGRLAEQNDFEGKIAVHKDETLGFSDCRVEWKNGGVERKAAAIFDKFENLINDKERGNGE